jgi:DNA helicase-2/ATP-dependent DNA helicase PcrA
MEMAQKNHRQYVIAPAGHGKTEQISCIVSGHSGDKKILILTHTNAGVLSLLKRIKKKPNDKLFEVLTIDSFSIKHAIRFPSITGVNKMPEKDADYKKCREGIIKLAKTKYFKKVLNQNYDQVIVDEYQDCNLDQHELIINITNSIPCLIFGDPMQGIFLLNGNELVDWDKDVFSVFEICPDIQLDIPHRWITHGVAELGEQIRAIREELENGNRKPPKSGAIKLLPLKKSDYITEYPKKIWEKIGEDVSLLILINDPSAKGSAKRKVAEKFKG